MRTKVATCTADTTIREATRILKKFNTSTVVIIDDEKHVLGVFSERDLVNKVITEDKDLDQPVKAVMTAPAICGDIGQTDFEIAAIIKKEHIKKVPILQKNKLVGIVAEHDLLINLADSLLNE